jgi:hypothetical protein
MWEDFIKNFKEKIVIKIGIKIVIKIGINWDKN